jgi:PAS domain S-box-containing protein
MSDIAPTPLPDGWFRALVDRAPEMVYRCSLVDPVGFEYASPAARLLTGLSPEELQADPSTVVRFIVPEAVEGQGGLLLAADLPPRFVAQHTRGDGSSAWLEVDRWLITDAGGRVVAAEGTVAEVGRRVPAESRAEFETRIVNAIRDGVVVSGSDHRVIYWNPGAERVLGIAAADALGRTITDLLPDQVPGASVPLSTALVASLPWDGDLRLASPDGEDRRLEVMSYPLLDEEAGPARVFILWDVTKDRRVADVAARLAAIVEHADDAIWTLDADATVLTWNRGAERMTGWSAERVVGGPSPVVTPSPEERAPIRQRALAGETVRIDPAMIRHVDGTDVPVSILVGPVLDGRGEVTALSVIARDERPRAEAIRELRFRDEILSSVQDAIIATDVDHRLRYLSPAAVRLLGVPAEEALGRRLDDIAAYRLVGTSATEAARALARGESVHTDAEVTLGDGQTRLAAVTAANLVGPDGSAMTMALIRDVTDARRAARDSARLAAIVESAGDAIIGTTAAGTVVSWNPAAERLTGYAAREIVGRTFAAFIAPEHLPLIFAVREQLIAGSQPHATADVTYLTRAGDRIPVSVSLAATRDGSGEVTGINAIAKDLRARRELEGQLRQAQKLEAVGRLAGGIAHDFSNLLTAITGYASLLAAELPAESPHLEDVGQILHASERATDLTQSLLAFTREKPIEARVVHLDTVVGELLPMLQRLIPEQVKLRVDLDAGAAVKFDPTDLELMLVNLLVNASEAMPSGGDVLVTTRLRDLDLAFADSHLGVRPGLHAEIVVTDTGTGMTDEVRAHVFEPFFTTRSGNSGMGLANVHAGVDRAGGTVWLSTEPGRGTEFRILVPASPIPPPVVAPALPASPPGGSERILLVEDDALVRALATAVLRRGGYEVVVKPDPREALDLDPALVDLLVTDLVMPGVSGTQLARTLKERSPDLPVLFMTGFAERSAGPEISSLSSQAMLRKPFSPVDLLAAVRTAIDEADGTHAPRGR